MNWHTAFAAEDELETLLGVIHTMGGVITRSAPCFSKRPRVWSRKRLCSASILPGFAV